MSEPAADRIRTPEGAPATVRACPGGPLLVTGTAVVEDDEGRLHDTWRPVSAVCRCGSSARAPWCDGTHKLLPEARRPA